MPRRSPSLPLSIDSLLASLLIHNFPSIATHYPPQLLIGFSHPLSLSFFDLSSSCHALSHGRHHRASLQSLQPLSFSGWCEPTSNSHTSHRHLFMPRRGHALRFSHPYRSIQCLASSVTCSSHSLLSNLSSDAHPSSTLDHLLRVSTFAHIPPSRKPQTFQHRPYNPRTDRSFPCTFSGRPCRPFSGSFLLPHHYTRS